ncbi:MAG: tRNA pseudouridine(38-40) synthase TruA [Saprospiraceae bacterium]|nr:tRNA pseudouridine(38-40) synthase TruA [Saprospiraceae bacterium]
MARYFIKLSYCGTNYNGWQSQPHKGTFCVQDTIEKAISTFIRHEIKIVGCGRTDTGVHAINYFAHFDYDGMLNSEDLVFRLNKMLPIDISIQDVMLVNDNSHARFDASSRSYQYHLHTSKSPFLPLSFFYYYEEPDFNMLNEAAAILLDYYDFTTFCKVNSDVSTMNCHISESRWERHNNHYTYFITSDRFLRGMIRLIVGMCLNVSRGKVTLDEVREALEHKKRLQHDWSVPANGLFLCDIIYPYEFNSGKNKIISES